MYAHEKLPLRSVPLVLMTALENGGPALTGVEQIQG
jgi:hypothetical protein